MPMPERPDREHPTRKATSPRARRSSPRTSTRATSPRARSASIRITRTRGQLRRGPGGGSRGRGRARGQLRRGPGGRRVAQLEEPLGGSRGRRSRRPPRRRKVRLVIETQVLVVGGGATGVGVARDAALRGLAVVLVERRDLAEGTTGRFHGLLHSGGRYVVKDPHAARECMRREPHPAPDRRPLHRGHRRPVRLHAGRRRRLRRRVPRRLRRRRHPGRGDRRRPRRCGASRCLHPGIQRAFAVPDAAIDTWRLGGRVRRGRRPPRRHRPHLPRRRRR